MAASSPANLPPPRSIPPPRASAAYLTQSLREVVDERSLEHDALEDRFAMSLGLTATISVFAVAERLGLPLASMFPPMERSWIELAVATPLVMWCAWPLFVRSVASIRRRRPNAFTLLGLSAALTYAYSVAATIAPLLGSTIPGGGPYFLVSGCIVTVALFAWWIATRSVRA